MNGSRSTPARRRLRLAALVVAVIGVLALAAAAFVLSYPGARDTALHAGVTPRLARIYPAIFDAVLLVACAAALALRGALRGYAWLALLVVTAAIAAADATYAMAVTLPKRPLEATVAVVPWAVLLIGFTLLYAIARQGRSGWGATQASADEDLPAVRRLDTPADPGNGIAPPRSAATVPLSELLAVKTPVTNTDPAAEPAPAPQADPPAEPKTRRAKRRAAAQTQPTPAESAVIPDLTIPESTVTPEPTVPEATVTQEALDTAEPAVTTEASASSDPAVTPEPPAAPEPTAAPGLTVTPISSATPGPAAAPEPAVPAESTEGAESTAIPQPAPVHEPVLSPEPTVSREPQDASEPPVTQGTAATLPELPRRRSVLRDDPSDADAESPEPAAYFNRLRSSPTPPGD